MRVFISYASEDRGAAEEIRLALAGAGHKVFFDKESLPPGDDYHERIRRAVERSDVLVFLITHNSVASGSYALTELKYARRKWPHPKGKLLPVRIGDVDWNAIPPYLREVTILQPEGNLPAEVVAALSVMHAPGRRKRLLISSAAAGMVVIGAAAGIYLNRADRTGEGAAVEKSAALKPPAAMRGAVVLKSEVGDFIGDGKTHQLTSENGKLSARAKAREVNIFFEGDDHWSLDFVAPEGKPLQPGTYASAQRAPFQNPIKPGLSVSGAGRGCNKLTGSFTVKSVEVSGDTLRRFSADFEQYCDENKAPLRGSVDLSAADK